MGSSSPESGASEEYSSDEYSSLKEGNANGKGGAATPYSLRRSKQAPVRFGADEEENKKLNSTSKKSPHNNQKQSTRPSSRGSNNNNSSGDEEGESNDDKQEVKYALRPRSQISYKEPENFNLYQIDKRHSSSSKAAFKATQKQAISVITVEPEGRPGLRPRKLEVLTSELSKYKQYQRVEGSSDESDDGDEEEDDEDERQRRGPLTRRRSSRLSRIEESSESDSGSERSSGGASGIESDGEETLSEGEDDPRVPKKVITGEMAKKIASPKKNEVRRSKRARITPTRYTPLSEQQQPPHAAGRTRFPNLPRSWASGGDSSRGRSSKYYPRVGYDSSSSSGDDLPHNLPSLRLGASVPQPVNLRPLVSSKSDTAPVDVDSSVNWESVGGLSYHIQQLKEMVLLPLLYPEVFNRFNVTPPKGVLFYGPPGTGKTLMARALANSCSDGGKKVAFFMRKGADCLSKWVGEAERQLRLLFEQAKNMQPAIIFFDEIDGLAPVRSSKQDQIHSSIVSTLLALMDGLDNRGTVIVIGATNRLDSIDPALRRPGRFDREFLFTLPGREARKEIINIHTRSWQPPLQPELVEDLATRCVGYCGADIKSLCTEAVLVALRQRYPQIYDSKEKLKINLDSIKVEQAHFVHAMSALTPASHRSALVHAIPLSKTLAPLLSSAYQKLVTSLQSVFPMSALRKTKGDLLASSTFSSLAPLPSAIYRPRLLLSGNKGMGQSQLGAALLHQLEEFPVFSIDLPSLLSDPTAKSIEEAGMHVLSEAKRVQPCVVFIPHIDTWWEEAEYAVLRRSLTAFLQDLDPSFPLLLFATADRPVLLPAHALTRQFSTVVECPLPTKEERKTFFESILLDIQKVLPSPRERRPLKVLPKVTAPVDLDLDKHAEEHILRQFRMVLRDILYRMLDDRRFYFFAKDLNPAQYPEYYQIVLKPISLSTLLQRCDACHYVAPSVVYGDLDTFVTNTINFYSNLEDEYSAQKVISRAKALQDTVVSLIEEIDPAVRSACEAILVKRGPTSPPPSTPVRPVAPPPVASPSSSEKLNRRSSARLRGEKPVYSVRSPPDQRKVKREGKEGESEGERESQDEAADGDSESRNFEQGDDHESSRESRDESREEENQKQNEKDKNHATVMSTTESSAVLLSKPTVGVTYTEKELVIIGDADPSLLLSFSENFNKGMFFRDTKPVLNGKAKPKEKEDQEKKGATESEDEQEKEDARVTRKRTRDDQAGAGLKKLRSLSPSKSLAKSHSPPRRSLRSRSSSRNSPPSSPRRTRRGDMFDEVYDNSPTPSNSTSTTTTTTAPISTPSKPTSTYPTSPSSDNEKAKTPPTPPVYDIDAEISDTDKHTDDNGHKRSHKKKSHKKKVSEKKISQQKDNSPMHTEDSMNGRESDPFDNARKPELSPTPTTNTTTTTTSTTSSNNNNNNTTNQESKKDEEMEEEIEEEVEEEEEVIEPIVDTTKVKALMKDLVAKTETFSVEELVELHARISSAMHRHHSTADKSELIKEMATIVKNIKPIL